MGKSAFLHYCFNSTVFALSFKQPPLPYHSGKLKSQILLSMNYFFLVVVTFLMGMGGWQLLRVYSLINST